MDFEEFKQKKQQEIQAQVQEQFQTKQNAPILSAEEKEKLEKIIVATKKLREEGNSQYKKKQFEKAKLSYQKAIEGIQPYFDVPEIKELITTLYCNLSGTHLTQKNYNSCIDCAFNALSFTPTHVKTLFRRASAYLEMGNFEQAKLDLEKAISYEPTNKELFDKLEEVKKRSQNPVFSLPDSVNLETFDEDGVIPRFHYKDPNIYKYILNELPVILTGSPLVKSALGKWDLDYLSENIIENDNSVYVSTGNQFMYHDEQRNLGKYPYVPKTFQVRMSCKDFVNQLRTHIKTGKLKIYMQQSLTKECSGAKIVKDFQAFDWPWLNEQQAKLGMGYLKNNTLWVGMPGVITPLHFDEAYNFFSQVIGRKLFKLYNPKYFGNVYPYPCHHYYDRQCQVDIDNPDLERFPKFKDAKCVQGIVHPGDVLYLPPYWFHYVASLDTTVSVNFWYVMRNDTKAEDIQFPLRKQTQIMAFRRNIEKFIADTMGANNVGSFLNDMYEGRFGPHLYQTNFLQLPSSHQQNNNGNQNSTNTNTGNLLVSNGSSDISARASTNTN